MFKETLFEETTYNTDEKDNSVTVYIWKNKATKKNNFNYGHVAIETANNYISFYPGKLNSQTNQKRSKIRDCKARLFKGAEDIYFAPNKQKDLDINGNQHLTFIFNKLLFYKIDEKYDGLKKDDLLFRLLKTRTTGDDGNHKHFFNCSSFALKLLISGGLPSLLDGKDPEKTNKLRTDEGDLKYLLEQIKKLTKKISNELQNAMMNTVNFFDSMKSTKKLLNSKFLVTPKIIEELCKRAKKQEKILMGETEEKKDSPKCWIN